MRAEVVAMTGECLNLEALKRAGEILKNGGLVAFPTETVYGLGGDALNPQASKKIYAAKGRPSDNPLIVHIADMDSLYRIVKTVPEKARILAGKYWPGPLTMIFQKSDIVPMETTGGLDSVAVRFPSDPVAAALIRAAGGYVAAPSANTSGRPSPTTAQHVEEDLGDAIDMIIDGGAVGIGLESTIVDFTEEIPVVLRLANGKRVGIIAAQESCSLYPKGTVKCIGSREKEETIAHNLYEILREFDQCQVDQIYSEAFYTPQMGQAIMNRLLKAAGHKVISV